RRRQLAHFFDEPQERSRRAALAVGLLVAVGEVPLEGAQIQLAGVAGHSVIAPGSRPAAPHRAAASEPFATPSGPGSPAARAPAPWRRLTSHKARPAAHAPTGRTGRST